MTSNLHNYAKKAFLEKGDSFPFLEWAQSFLLKQILCIYGEICAKTIERQWKNHFVVETGSHLGFFKTKDSPLDDENKIGFNTIAFQGLINSIALHHSFDQGYHVTLGCDWTPLSSDFSACYEEIERGILKRLYSNKYKETPHYLLPDLPSWICEKYDVSKNLSISEKIAKIASDKVNLCLSNTSIRHICLPFETLGRNLFLKVMADKNSVTSRMLKTPKLYQYFYDEMLGAPTAWKEGENIVKYVIKKGDTFRISSFHKKIDLDEMILGIQNGTLILSTPLLYFILLIETGMIPIGGANQIRYVERLLKIGIYLLDHLQENERADLLRNRTLNYDLYSLVWGGNEKKELMQWKHFSKEELFFTDEKLHKIAYDLDYRKMRELGKKMIESYMNSFKKMDLIFDKEFIWSL